MLEVQVERMCEGGGTPRALLCVRGRSRGGRGTGCQGSLCFLFLLLDTFTHTPVVSSTSLGRALVGGNLNDLEWKIVEDNMYY